MSLNICRICENTNNLKNLFSKEYGDISYKIMSCANVTIEPDDNLPQFICDQCKINLNIAYEFKKQCEFNDKKWRMLFESKEIYHDNGIEDEKYCNVSTDYYATGVDGNGDDDNNNDNMQNNNTIFNFEESIHPLFTTNKEISVDSNSNEKCEIYNIIGIDILNENSIQEITNLNENENEENQKHNELLTFYTDLNDNNKDLDKCTKIEEVSNNRNDDNNDCIIFEDYIEEEYIENEYDDDDDNNDEYKNKNYNEREHQILELDDYLEICKNKSENENYDSIIEEVIDDEDGDSQSQQSSTFGIIEESSNISANKSINNENNNNYNDGETRETLPLLSSLSSVTTDNNIVLKFSKTFECDTCKEKFVSSKEFNQHKRMHGNKRYQCMKCLKWFSHRFRLKNHLQIHEKNKILYKCNKCNNQYSSQGNLDRHIKNFHKNIKPYVCMECGLSFSRSHTYNIHQAVHIEERNYECDKCGKRFKTPYYLNVHKKIHLPKELRKKKSSSASSSSVNSAATKTKTKTKTKPELPVENIKCEYCSKISKSKSMHLSHTRKHSGEKPFICKYCNKAFAFRPSLRVHQFMHTGERPYKCELCDLSFRQFGHLKGHNLIHTGIKNYDCEHCGKKFAFKSNLVVHLRTHTGKTPYECNDCNQKFWDLNALKRHKNNHKAINTIDEQNELIIDETNINYYDYITT